MIICNFRSGSSSGYGSQMGMIMEVSKVRANGVVMSSDELQLTCDTLGGVRDRRLPDKPDGGRRGPGRGLWRQQRCDDCRGERLHAR